ncbi:MAG: tRNA (N(6)-L-threonylcarbamoyladenosine(37)-C(2))-methylthiotransferase MtaB [Candidatus Sericytochromatia bacterium]|nr:tRNA (N(6)-L-threonylcarbamoyladenosine(37)-C(2))-methylthiotransferase MtaB [Candidatus Sericytochromatia bacterium]
MSTAAPPRTVAFLSLGCRVNQAEESTYRQHSLENGWTLVDFRQPADIYIVNTCAVTLEAERQSRQMIRQAKRRNPEARIVVTGCAGRSLERHPEIKEVADLFVPNLTKDNLVSQLQQFLGEAPHPGFDYHFPHVSVSKTTRLNLKITDGCFESCAFCIIPARRGTVRSLPEDQVIERLNAAADLGYQEAILTGVHLGAYGHEHGQHGLDQLLERINHEVRLPRVRLSSIDPHEVTPRMIRALAESTRICPYLHLPIQSGSDAILERMRRRDQRAQIIDTVAALKAALPDISLTTDMIVGFPGESDADFEASYTLMETLGIHKIHVFPFSVRPGTRAAFMKEHVPAETKQARVQRLLAYNQQILQQWLQSWVGQTVPVLFERVDRAGVGKGYSPHYLRVHVANCPSEYWNTVQQVCITGIDINQEMAQAELVLK